MKKIEIFFRFILTKGELGASMRYLSQRFTMSNPRVAGLLTDIGVLLPELHMIKFD
jgi:Mn-containing catalase